MSSLALLGGIPVRRKPFAAWPVFDETERAAVLEVLESGSWGGYSSKVPEFEQAFAGWHGARFGISASNGTVTLEAALIAAGIGPGDEVIVPPITFIATATAVLRVGAVPVFVDIEPAAYNLDPGRISEAITPATRAIIPVHFAGHPADMDALLEIARTHNLILIEDAAHAHGASWNGRKVGTFGHFGSFSFQQSKNMTAGEGGILITSDPDLAGRARSFCNQGRRQGGAWYEHATLGTNYRLTGWQAAILLAQLARLPEQMEKRARNLAVLNRALAKSGVVVPPAVDSRVTGHGLYLYIMRLNTAALGDVSTDAFVEALRAEGIPGISRYPHPIYANRVFHSFAHKRLNCPEAERFCRECFWISHEILLAEEEDLADFVRAVEKVRDSAPELLVTKHGA
ncbi:MAG TPA: DegT/DnrJ/EryC1/StrS family aminotransferase [Bryobacteraceae bacterium]